MRTTLPITAKQREKLECPGLSHGHYDSLENPDSRHLNEVTTKVSDGPLDSAPWSYKIR